MSATIKGKILDGYLKRTRKRFGKRVKKDIKRTITKEIKSGKSPVQGQKFEPYSKNYAQRTGKNRRKVDMTLTGKMLRSLKAKLRKDGVVSLFFTDKKAKYHNEEGAGKSKVIRRLLPLEGEVFKRKIMDHFRNILRKVARKRR